MDAQVIITVITLLFTSGVAGIVVKGIFDRRKHPLDREQVLAAIASQNVDDALAIATAANTSAKEAKAEAKEARKDNTRLDRELRALRDWAADIVRNWHVVRTSEEPPPLPPEAGHPAQYSH